MCVVMTEINQVMWVLLLSPDFGHDYAWTKWFNHLFNDRILDGFYGNLVMDSRHSITFSTFESADIHRFDKFVFQLTDHLLCFRKCGSNCRLNCYQSLIIGTQKHFDTIWRHVEAGFKVEAKLTNTLLRSLDSDFLTSLTILCFAVLLSSAIGSCSFLWFESTLHEFLI